MFNIIALALCGVLAVASTRMEIPVEAFKAVAPKDSLVKMQLHGSRLGSTASKVSWSECQSLHLYDVATGTASPNPPTVGDFVGLNLDVIFNNDADVVGNYINVQFTAEGSTSPIALYA